MSAQNATVENIIPQRQANIHAIERRTPPPSVPEYVSHREDVTEIGKLSAEAMVKEYEATAKEIEAMGEIVKEMVQRCEQIAVSASAMLGEIKTTAARYRREGKRMFNEIESCSNVTEEVRRACESFRDKIAARGNESVP
jgi:prophage DNA circulation protein